MQFSVDYSPLADNLLDLVTEEQAKLGYRKEAIRFYYPLRALQNLMGIEADENEMDRLLDGFLPYMKARYGEVFISRDKKRFCFMLSEEISVYVHEHTDPDAFIVRLVGLVSSHHTNMEMVEDLFASTGKPFEKKDLPDEDFDTVFHFTDSGDTHYYCFKDEGLHLTYHRFLPADYQDLFDPGQR